jgi:hypothetical protein
MRTRAASIVILSSLLWVLPGLARAQDPAGTTFTTDADFALGIFRGTRAGAPDSGQLRIDTGASVPPFFWIANTSAGTVTKLDTRTGRQAARYDSVLTRNWDGSVPAVRPPRDSCNNPVLTAVDAKGNAFVVNRGSCTGVSASITKYAGSLAECVDRNGNGVIDTSSDANGNGTVEPNNAAEFKGQGDECVLWTKNYAAAEDQGRSIVVDADQNVWAAGFSSSRIYQLSGMTGAVQRTIDLQAETGGASGIQALAIGPGGYLYTSDNTTLRLIRKINPSAPEGSRVVGTLISPVPTSGLAVDRNGMVWLGADSDSASGVVQADFVNNLIQMVGGGGGCTGRTHGVAVDAAGDIWAACPISSRVLRLSSSGTFKNSWSFAFNARPEGVAVAADGRIWVTLSGIDMVAAINPAVTGSAQSSPSGGASFSLGDMTGFHHHRFIARQGSWSAVHDSGTAATNWGTLAWNQEPQGAAPPGTEITVYARAADTTAALASQAFVRMTNGQSFAGIQGRFIEALVTLRSVNFSGEPVLSDLRIATSNHPPVARCQAQDVCAGPACTAQVSSDNGSYDPDGDAITLAQSPEGPYGIGSRAVTLAVSDGSLSESCSASVSVRDCEPPTITCGQPVQAECTGSESASVSVGEAEAADACSTVSVTGPGLASYPLGTTDVTYTATDAAGNTATCTTQVQVRDTLPPSITCPAPATEECVNGGATNSGVGPATATDVCSPAAVQSPGLATFPLGTATLTWSAADTSGNTVSCSTPFTVADTQAPSITLVGPASQALECGSSYTDPWVTATDACVGPLTGQVVATGAIDPARPGNYTRSYSVVDPSGNASAEVTRTVTVADTQGPALTLHGANPMPLECMRDWYSEPGATAVDMCAGPLSGAITIESPYIDSAVPGPYAVTYRVADSSGNVASAVREVRVQDTLAPEISLNGAASPALECQVDTYVEQGATAYDLCSGPLTAITITGTVDTAVAGTYPVRYRAQDGQGQVAERVRDVRVVDTRPPTLTVAGTSTPVMECSRDAFIALGATATDLCAGDISHRITISGTEIIVAPGTYPITYNVTDPAGNAAPSITRNVTVQDTRAPVVTIMGQADMTLECNVDTYTELGATAYDACQGDMTSQLNIYGNGANTSAVGTYSIQYGVWDSAGNTTMALRTVRVVDRLAPTLTMVGPSTVQHECASGPYVDRRPTAFDVCYGDLSSSVTTTGSVNAWGRGTYTLTYNVEDSARLKATSLTRTVQVVDTQPPAIEYTVVTLSPADQALRSFSLADCVTASDTCDGFALANDGTLLSIYSDEPEDAPGDSDGSTLGDIVITGRSSFQLRAERQSGGDGRVYGVTFELKDRTGNVRTGLCQFRVPAAEAGAANDNGAGEGYTVTAPPPDPLASAQP